MSGAIYQQSLQQSRNPDCSRSFSSTRKDQTIQGMRCQEVRRKDQTPCVDFQGLDTETKAS